MTRILVTGGAGFVGSNLAALLKRDMPNDTVICFDNLKRRGSELTLARLKKAGITFVHGDIRNDEDLAAVGPFDILLDCAAEPSVHAGTDGDPRYLINTNLIGTLKAMEFARRYKAGVIFLSSSRIYPIATLRDLPLEQKNDRFVISTNQKGPGWSPAGITTDFPLKGARSLYGSTKLAAELLIEEYRNTYDLHTIINRCGVLTGPWQMGKVDQGFIVLWAARHCYGGNLAYMGFGGTGYQVRDILHVADLYNLIKIQLRNISTLSGSVFNVGGGHEISVSLRELTGLCGTLAGRDVEIKQDLSTRSMDIPYYVTDNTRVTASTGWKPEHSVEAILEDVFSWLREHRADLEPILS